MKKIILLALATLMMVGCKHQTDAEIQEAERLNGFNIVVIDSCDITEKKGFEFGKSRRVYRIDSNWYESKKDFIKALKNFSFGRQKPIKGGKK